MLNQDFIQSHIKQYTYLYVDCMYYNALTSIIQRTMSTNLDLQSSILCMYICIESRKLRYRFINKY
jgi:hypothetical protein